MAITEKVVAIIGCGSMGTAIAGGILDALADTNNVKSPIMISRLIATVGTDAAKKRVVETLSRHAEKLDIRLRSDNLEVFRQADIIVLSVKPVKWRGIIEEPGMREALGGKLLISIIAGVKTEVLHQAINGSDKATRPQMCQIVRTMPNMGAQIRRSMTLGTTIPGTVSEQNMETTRWILEQVGKFQLTDEVHFDMSGVLVGCAGSLIMLAVDGLLDAAVSEGLKRSEAQPLVVESAIGMLSLLTRENGGHPSLMRELIASPGGSSIRALLELEKQGVRSAYTEAIIQAAERSKEMSKL
ncbi:hypothetical protein EsH8_X_000091 [Colletotrichum jinshuiense]